jgi:hypothetical protein
LTLTTTAEEDDYYCLEISVMDSFGSLRNYFIVDRSYTVIKFSELVLARYLPSTEKATLSTEYCPFGREIISLMAAKFHIFID